MQSWFDVEAMGAVVVLLTAEILRSAQDDGAFLWRFFVVLF
jgi:hypothetical protein